jgi:hypothetical protein
VFPSFELANAVTRLPPDSSFPTSERVEGETWSGIVRDYQVYPLLGARYRMSEQSIGVTYADPDTSKPVTVEVAVPDIEFGATVPAGAEGLDPYLAGTSFSLERQVDGDPASLAAGDALVLTYRAELVGLPAMFLPDLAGSIDVVGISAYAEEPVIEDVADIAVRTEKVTLILNAGGSFTIPGRRLEWWNPDSGRIESTVVTPLELTVSGPPLATPDVDGTVGFANELEWSTLLLWLVTAAAAIALARVFVPRMLRRRREARRAWRQSEAYQFEMLQNSLRSDDPRTVYERMLVWLDRLTPGADSRTFALRFGSDELIGAVEELRAGLYRGDASAPAGSVIGALRSGLPDARRKFLQDFQAVGATSLSPLNP